ncbi:MAG: CO2 hydration protein, partial [Cyanobacteria bacterium J06659_2]
MSQTITGSKFSTHPYSLYIERLLAGKALLPDGETNVLEVVGILDSYGVVLDAYSKNLIYIAEHQFLKIFPFFKYFNGEVSWGKLLQYWWHDRINYEYAEYCMRTMMWHGGGGLDTYLDTPEFSKACEVAIQAKLKGNPFMQALHRV